MKNVTFTTQRSISRRAMLKGTGITLALPWLDAMSAAFAADPKPPMRFIGILNYFSFHAPNLFPKEAGANYIATPYLEGLQPQRKEFTIISGLNHPEVRDGHASDKSFFTGAPHPGSPSFKNTASLPSLMWNFVSRVVFDGKPSMKTTKCRCGPLARPTFPLRAITSPCFTLAPTFSGELFSWMCV